MGGMGPKKLPDTPEEVLAYAQEKLREPGGYTYANHAIHERMDERNATVRDVKRAIRTATTAIRQPNGTWRLAGGTDSEGEPLVPVVDIRQQTMIIVNVL
ncbi:uncharacterized protein SOCE836_001510 [Sorangium cellulosum]|uniref:DUF4258 domain-containing protein n=2 Tax=Polyangiaceae TaxID=49 RepID=A0A4P2QFS3_SORCE|nr:uncharacterized protein SOCE836_001510 [Sorangium cellulosum]WCQ87486.1 hypothetical protein NQZ70_00149 [Sorangium sp. Soce836]